MADIFDTLCGESGVVNQITETQDQIRQVVTAGKNAISQVKQFANDIENSEEALRDPAGTIAQLLAIAAAYQAAGPAIDRIIENVRQFIEDPLNTPLDLCKDIPNIVKVGEEVFEFAQPAVVPDKPPEVEKKDDFTKEIGISDFEIIPRFPTRSISEAVEAAGRFTGQPGPGDANAAAIGQ
jgi:hypothetical protein